MSCCCRKNSEDKAIKNKIDNRKETQTIPSRSISKKVKKLSKVNMASDSTKNKSNTSLTKDEKKKSKEEIKKIKEEEKKMAKEEKRRSKEEKERRKNLSKEEKKKQKSEKDNKKDKSKSSTDKGKDENNFETKGNRATKDSKSSEKDSASDIVRSGKGRIAVESARREDSYPFLPSRFEMPRGQKGYVFPVTPGPARYPVTGVNYPIMKATNQKDLTKKMILGPSPPAYTMGIRHTEFREFYNKIQ